MQSRILPLVAIVALLASCSAETPEAGGPTVTDSGAAVEPALLPAGETPVEPTPEPAVDGVPEHIGEKPGAVALNQMKEITKALEFHYLETGAYPESLDALTESTSDNPKGYIDRIPPDPWGSAFIYRHAGRKFELASAGPDGKEGNEDDVKLPRR